jgi:hypothetical protein
VVEIIEGTLAPSPNADHGAREDGPEAGRHVWYHGRRADVTGRIYAVLEFMWDRDWATFDELISEVNRG